MSFVSKSFSFFTSVTEKRKGQEMNVLLWLKKQSPTRFLEAFVHMTITCVFMLPN